ncbi:LysE family translocator [Oceaniglobus roseus]|uniref:LysE family translocator n=1 Tax=Oceaniglobus roseus TaxID=1737570 RepID=UPI000C7EE33F|nr:LysE family translocator [Kandeliimicrobium roseum]
MSPEFLLTALVVVLLPGTGVIYTLAVGLGRGFRASVFAAVGCTLGIVPAALAGIAGLAALLHASALAFQMLKLLGAAYLLFMAWQILKDGGTLDVRPEVKPRTPWAILRDGTLLNVLNPKLSLFFLAFLPQFVPHDAAHPTALLLGLAGVFMAMTLAVFIAYGACAALARDHVLARPRVMLWLRRSFAVTFGLLGLKLATER